MKASNWLSPIIVISVLITLVSCGASPNVKKARYMESGDKFLAAKSYQEAADAYGKALTVDANDKNIYLKIATVHSESGDIGQSLFNLKKARDLDPKDIDIRLKIAREFIVIRKTDECRKELESVLDDAPGNLDALNLLSDIAATPDQIDDAISKLKALQPEPQDKPRVKLDLGKLYFKKGDISKAENLFLDSLKDGDLPASHAALGDVAAIKKDFNQAEQEYKAAADLVPETSIERLKLADFYIFRKNLDQAERVLEAIVEKSPDFVPALHRLARIELDKQNLEKCDKFLQTVFRKNPSDLEGRTIYAQLLIARNEIDQAIAELDKVDKALPDNPLPNYLLGLAYMKKGDLFKARTFLEKAVRLEPNFIQAVLLLSEADVSTGMFRSATERMQKLLERDSGNVEAYLILTEAARDPEDIENALKTLQRVQPFFRDNGRFSLALGSLYLNKGDPARAQGLIQEVLDKNPDSINAHMLMGDCLLKKKDRQGAEQEFKKAVELSPGAATYLKLAAFYLIDGNSAEARKILTESAQKFPDFLPASFQLAKIAFSEKDYTGVANILESILKKNPDYADALLLRGQVKLAQNKSNEAMDDFQAVLKVNPNSEEALGLIGNAYIQQNDLTRARSTLRELMRIAPNLYDQRVKLAELDLRAGDFRSAADNAEVLIGKGFKDPVLYLLLGSAYLGKKDPDSAQKALRKYLENRPDDSRGNYLLGLALRSQGKREEAAKLFEDSLNSPQPYLDSLAQLVSIDMAETNLDSALRRVKKQIDIMQDNAQLYYLLGTVYIARKETSSAESAYQKAVEIDPKFIPGRIELAKVYAFTNRIDKAFIELDEVAKLEPKNIEALMLKGILYQQKENIPKAREVFETIMGINPSFSSAANNLAYIYCEYTGEYDKALNMARMAIEGEPENPNIADTLGWVLYKEKNFELALSYLKESAGKLPDNAEVLFHLGMTQYQLGKYGDAKKSLDRALEKGKNFKFASEAKRVLTEMAK